MTYLEARAKRVRAKVRRKELAEALQMSEASLKRFESGERPLPGWVTLNDLFETIERMDWRTRKPE